MGALNVPLAASGGPAPVLLVEVMTKAYVTPGAGPSGPTPPTPPAPPRAAVAGETITWAYASAYAPYVLNGPGGPVIGAASATDYTATISMSAGDPLGQNTYGITWSSFAPLTPIPFGATITDVYPVFTLNCNGSGSAGAPGSNAFNGAGSGTFYGPNVATLTGQTAFAQLYNTVPGGASLLMTVTFVGMAVYYTGGVAPPTGGASGPDTSVADQLAAGIFFWSEHRAKWPSVLEAGALAQFLDFLVGPQRFQLFGSSQTDTATITVQNVSGNTVDRDIMTAFVAHEFIGALVHCRIWDGAAETALLTFLGNVVDVEIDDNQMVLMLEGFGNYSAIAALPDDIDVACQRRFGSMACGSTSPTPCDQTYGTCTSLNRFAGVIAEWVTETPDVQLAQPAPTYSYNPRRPF